MLERLSECYVDALRLAKTGQQLQGELDVAGLSRLVPLLANANGKAAVTLQFGIDEQGISFVRGNVRCTLQVICQRCLTTMPLDVDASVCLGMVTSPEAARELPGEYEPLVMTAEPVSIASVVEDELILALPIVALHPQGACVAEEGTRETEDPTARDDQGPRKTKPFAVLAGLKTRR